MADTEKKYTNEYGRLRRLTSKIDGQIRQISVSEICIKKIILLIDLIYCSIKVLRNKMYLPN